eukprot:scaffold10771_cov42-Attheya_sp.AAC.1
MNKESDKIVPACKKRKQQKQRKIMHDSIDSRASKENEHYMDKFTFGFDSDDGTMVSLGDLSGITPIDWCIDEAIHSRTLPPRIIYNGGAEVYRNNANANSNAAKRKQKLNT